MLSFTSQLSHPVHDCSYPFGLGPFNLCRESRYYYIRVVVNMYMHEGDTVVDLLSARPALAVAIVLAAIGTVLLGVFPSGSISLAKSRFWRWDRYRVCSFAVRQARISASLWLSLHLIGHIIVAR